MPLTFLSHQAPVLPLKLRWPRHVDGTALVIGSMVPDLLFVIHGTDNGVDSHGVLAQLWVCGPLAIVLTIITKRVVAGVLGPHLPARGPFALFGLRAYGRLSAWTVPRSIDRWAILVTSALVGCYSHLVLDSFTHNWGYAAELLGLSGIVVWVPPVWISTSRPLYLTDLLQVGFSAAGIAIVLVQLRLIARRRLLETSYPDVEPLRPTPASRRVLWRVTLAATAAGLVSSFVPGLGGGHHDHLFRSVDAAFVGLVLGSLLARPKMVGPATTTARARVPVGSRRS